MRQHTNSQMLDHMTNETENTNSQCSYLQLLNWGNGKIRDHQIREARKQEREERR
jgi:hypothetical protein